MQILEGEYSTDVVSDKAVSYIRKAVQEGTKAGQPYQPFYLQVTPISPHTACNSLEAAVRTPRGAAGLETGQTRARENLVSRAARGSGGNWHVLHCHALSHRAYPAMCYAATNHAGQTDRCLHEYTTDPAGVQGAAAASPCAAAHRDPQGCGTTEACPLSLCTPTTPVVRHTPAPHPTTHLLYTPAWPPQGSCSFPVPATRHRTLFADANLPQAPNFMVPPWPELGLVSDLGAAKAVQNHYVARLRANMAVDEMIGRICECGCLSLCRVLRRVQVLLVRFGGVAVVPLSGMGSHVALVCLWLGV